MKEKIVETKLPVGRIVKIEELPDGAWVIKQKVVVEEKATSEKTNSIPKSTSKKTNSIPKITIRNSTFVLIEAENLSLDDEFMKYQPRTAREAHTRDLIAEAIGSQVKNFYRPIMDPYITISDENICYEKGREPAVGKCYYWWERIAKNFCSERNSRLGTRLQYCAFLGVLIKKLVEEGKSAEWAWNAVCNDSTELGHYFNAKDTMIKLEPTGSRCICEFYDLANTYKILAEDEEADGFWLAGGNCHCEGCDDPLAVLRHGTNCLIDNYGSVGWLVLS